MMKIPPGQAQVPVTRRDDSRGMRQRFLMALVLLIGLGITWSATRESILSAEREAYATFQAAANLMIDRAARQIDQRLQTAESLQRFSSTTDALSDEDLQRFFEIDATLFATPRVVTLVLAAPAENSDAIVDRARRGGRADFMIRRFEDAPPRGPLQGEAFVIYMAEIGFADASENLVGHMQLIGIDISAYEDIAAILREARMKGMSVTTPAPPTVAEVGGSATILLVSPVGPIDGMDAFVVQLEDLDALLEEARLSAPVGGISMAFYASSADGAQVRGFGEAQPYSVNGVEAAGTDDPYRDNDRYSFSRTIRLGANIWQARTSAPRSLIPADYGRAVITASVCLVLIGLVLFIMRTQSMRANRVQEIVYRRTRALKNAHKELEQHNKLLQSLNDELVDARKAAETANRAKSEFLATVSHELRTPLNAILGFSQILADQSLGPVGDKRYVDYAVDINESGNHLLRLINDILDLAKLEAGKMRIEKAPFRVRDLADRVRSLLRKQAADKGLTLNVTVDETLPEQLMGDMIRLRQILINLSSNAIKFTEEGGVTIRMAHKPMDNGAPGWVMQVTDTGIGIPSSKLPSLFDRFTQVDAAHSRQHGGVGLGLAICRELVERMGGFIHVESTLTIGSTLQVHLPLEIMPSDGVLEDDVIF
ncbi:ATP-binding protein [Eilatimonas milleporae]|uniref:histidine kinase n=1 Tax=Eilatimonas milleporae TaxID=911205 RepID=A0A3M0CQD2_9PROT|nr:ATP-binding protein [Eilatimonas milleporae]RMB11748.1 signal transduction histidine kinase [Eilatimonas milleporae]